MISSLLCKFNFGHLPTILSQKLLIFKPVNLDISVQVFLELSPGDFVICKPRLPPGLWLDANALYCSFRVSEYLRSANREGTGEAAFLSLVPHFNLIFSLSLSNSNVTPRFICMERILIYTSSVSFKIASISLKSKTLSTFGNYLWNPLT